MVSRRKSSICRRSGKLRLTDELEAKMALAVLKRKDKGQKRYYFCKSCRGYHTTSQEARS